MSNLLVVGRLLHELQDALQSLESCSAALELSPLANREWYQLLAEKLLPQIDQQSYLVLAVVGGTNIGKSVVFNHISGCRASATSPLASGTKHPTCLLSSKFETNLLGTIFQGFDIRESDAPENAIQESDRDLLFWRKSDATPENLLVLDTPDIDSDAEINWDRADKIRRSADVLVAVLTQQKYNDAAVKQFFRKAASEDKAVVIVFNQCLLPDDEQYWPHWVGTFCEETGIDPELIYLSPHDRESAEKNELPFYLRHWPIEEREQTDNERHDLLADFSRLRFKDIKLRTLRGSLATVTDRNKGVPDYLYDVRRKSGDFQHAMELVATQQLAEQKKWPAVPNALLIQSIRAWWAEQRTGWTAAVHGTYNTLGTGLMWPFRFVARQYSGEAEDPHAAYKKQEWQAILDVVESVFEKLNWMNELGNDLLKPRLEKLLSGHSRENLIQHLEQVHQEIDLSSELDRLVSTELATFKSDNPGYYDFFRKLDSIAAAARPMTSVALFVVGFGPVGHVMAPVIADTAAMTAMHVVGDVTAGTVTAAVGETAISSTASSSAGYLEMRFRKLHQAFIEQRASWLASQLQDNLLGELVDELSHAAKLTGSEEYKTVESTLKELEAEVRKLNKAIDQSADSDEHTNENQAP